MSAVLVNINIEKLKNYLHNIIPLSFIILFAVVLIVLLTYRLCNNMTINIIRKNNKNRMYYSKKHLLK